MSDNRSPRKTAKKPAAKKRTPAKKAAAKKTPRKRPPRQPQKRLPGNPTGRPVKLNERTLQVYCQALRASGNLAHSARAAHLTVDTVKTWRARGHEERLAYLTAHEGVDELDLDLTTVNFDEYPFLAFLVAADRARSEFVAEVFAVARKWMLGFERDKITTKTYDKIVNGKVRKIVETTVTKEHVADWRAGIAALEKGMAAEFGRQMQLTGAGGGPLQVEITEQQSTVLAMVIAGILDDLHLTAKQRELAPSVCRKWCEKAAVEEGAL